MSYGKVEVKRFSYGPNGTFGELFINGQFFCYTVERPWLGNKSGESCIPEGEYKLQPRYSPVVEKTSRGEFKEGYEVTGVPGRQYIMIHVANVPSDLQGCLGCGKALGFVKDQWAVTDSVNTFRELMHKLDDSNDWDIEITRKEYP